MREDSRVSETAAYGRIIQRYGELPEATHAEAKRKWIAETEAAMRAADERARAWLHEFDYDEYSTSLRYGVRGLLLIAMGSVMQSAAALLVN
jgi:hypothetical protein